MYLKGQVFILMQYNLCYYGIVKDQPQGFRVRWLICFHTGSGCRKAQLDYERKEATGTINSIMEAIGSSLNGEFGDGYNICKEEREQGLERPCFFISATGSAGRLFPGNRYLRENQFCIQYFPQEEGKKREECYAVAEQLFSCLTWLRVSGEPVRGTKMRCEVVDGILHFYVNYDMVVRKVPEPVPIMEEVSSETMAKGQVRI